MDADAISDVPEVLSSVEVEVAQTTRASAPLARSRQVLPALCLGSFVATLPAVAPAPFLPAISRDLGVSVPLLGQVVTAMLFLSATLGLVVGPLADRYGYRRLIVVGLGAAVGCLLSFGLAPTFPLLLLASLAGGLASATVPGQSLAVAGTHFRGPAAHRAIGWTIAATAGSAIIGVPLLTAVGDLAGWRPAFVGGGLVTIAIAWFVTAHLPRDAHQPAGSLRVRTFLSAYRPLLHHAPMRRLYGATVLRMICWLGMLTYFGAFLDEQLGLSTRAIGLVYMLGGGGFFLASLVAGGVLTRVAPRLLVAGANVVVAVGWGLIVSAVLGPIGTIALVPLVGAAGALGWVALTTLLTAETPAGAGTTMALGMSLNNLGAAVGGAIGGLLLAAGGYDALSLGLPLFALASALLVGRSGPRPCRAT